jgi:hypothetical protein
VRRATLDEVDATLDEVDATLDEVDATLDEVDATLDEIGSVPDPFREIRRLVHEASARRARPHSRHAVGIPGGVAGTGASVDVRSNVRPPPSLGPSSTAASQ